MFKNEDFYIKELSAANILITQDITYPERFDINEIIEELKTVHETMNTQAMSQHSLFLQGQKMAIEQVIKYLEEVRGES